jgi:pimeloyl-ACP methyl ester carboxylesterase
VADIVLVPGSWHAGWYFNPILPMLRDHGHRPFAVTLTGLGDRRHLTHGAINLDTHIQDVVQLFEDEGIDDAVLVGHSYGGMVTTGAASRLHGRVGSLVYLDAMVPSHGQRLWDLVGPPWHEAFLGASLDGLTTLPPPTVDGRAAPHPLATMLQPVTVAPSTFDVANKVFVWAEAFTEGPFQPFYDRLSATDGWETHRVPYNHDLISEAPEKMAQLLLGVAGRHAPR